eukprot:gene22535-biopygen8768
MWRLWHVISKKKRTCQPAGNGVGQMQSERSRARCARIRQRAIFPRALARIIVHALRPRHLRILFRVPASPHPATAVRQCTEHAPHLWPDPLPALRKQRRCITMGVSPIVESHSDRTHPGCGGGVLCRFATSGMGLGRVRVFKFCPARRIWDAATGAFPSADALRMAETRGADTARHGAAGPRCGPCRVVMVGRHTRGRKALHADMETGVECLIQKVLRQGCYYMHPPQHFGCFIGTPKAPFVLPSAPTAPSISGCLRRLQRHFLLNFTTGDNEQDISTPLGRCVVQIKKKQLRASVWPCTHLPHVWGRRASCPRYPVSGRRPLSGEMTQEGACGIETPKHSNAHGQREQIYCTDIPSNCPPFEQRSGQQQ